MNKIIKENNSDLIKIFKNHRIKEAYVFGSVLRDDFKDESDIDILVSFDQLIFDGYAQNLWELEDKLEGLFKRKVDVIPEHTLKNPYFIGSINRNKVKIYG